MQLRGLDRPQTMPVTEKSMTPSKCGAPPLSTDSAVAKPAARAGLILAALAAGFVMASLDVTVVNVAGADIQQYLGASLGELTWIIDGYVLTFASLLMLGGALANRLGARRLYISGMVVFFVASLACALSPSAGVLIAARLVQGAGAALFMPSSLSLLVFAFPEKRLRTKMLGLWSAIVATAAGLGPTIGGLLVGLFGWQSIFLINLPVGILGIVLTMRYIAPAAGREIRIAVPGHGLWIAALAALSFALIEGPRRGWVSGPVLTAYIVLIIAAAVLIGYERRVVDLVMPWELFRRKAFTGANSVGFLFNLALYGSMFMLALYLQHARGATPFEAGLQLLPMTIWFPLGNLVYSRISAKFSNGAMLTLFLVIAAVASLTMITVSSSMPYWLLALAVGIANIGAGIISPGMTAALVDSAGTEHANVAGSVLNANRQIGTLVGIAIMSVILSSANDWNSAAAVSFLVIGVAYATAAVGAWLLIQRPEHMLTSR
ncbi:MFS transporter [Gordonia polyisoprenivorans]|uniref:MFS transporter n=1 Tax=Gordonia polyisoprenivorans TaxID=84595 RepID=UPI001FCBE07C|nr:MFS transporter [Gordonia polyisoprenivorans]